MANCGTCRFWGRTDGGHADRRDDRFRTCTAAIHASRSMDPETVDLEAAGDRKAAVVDGSGYFAALKSREDFGCVLHEPR